MDNNSVGAVSTYTFNHVISDHTISATFNPITFLITASAGTGGTISPSGEVTVNSGTNRTFNITPGDGFKINDVKVDDVSVGTVSSYTFSNVTANHIISATFAPLVTYTINSSAGPGGSINPLGILTVGGGTNQTYVITPDIGHPIADVTIDDIPSGAIATYTFNNITANHTISVTFAVTPTYTITSGAGTGGSIDPNGTVTVNEASNQTFLISPNSGYRISEVLVDNNPVGTCPITLSIIYPLITPSRLRLHQSRHIRLQPVPDQVVQSTDPEPLRFMRGQTEPLHFLPTLVIRSLM